MSTSTYPLNPSSLRLTPPRPSDQQHPGLSTEPDRCLTVLILPCSRSYSKLTFLKLLLIFDLCPALLWFFITYWIFNFHSDSLSLLKRTLFCIIVWPYSIWCEYLCYTPFCTHQRVKSVRFKSCFGNFLVDPVCFGQFVWFYTREIQSRQRQAKYGLNATTLLVDAPGDIFL